VVKKLCDFSHLHFQKVLNHRGEGGTAQRTRIYGGKNHVHLKHPSPIFARIMATDSNRFQAIISHCKEYGFIFPSSEIYAIIGGKA
jgi:hypothetical protein